MKKMKGNLLVQFSVISFVTMAILAVAIGGILTTRLERNVGLLKDHGAAMMSGQMIKPADTFSIPSLSQDVRELRWISYGAVGTGFIVLYVSLFAIVRRGWRTINQQQSTLVDTNEEMRATNQELLDTQEKLVRTERLAAISSLAAAVAHEIRNPLGGIKNTAYYINSKLVDSDLARENPKILQYLEMMNEEITSSNQIITDLMDFSRVNPPETAPTDIESLVENALSRIEVKDSVRVKKNFTHDVPEVSVDKDQVRRAITNLIRNADDAMEDGGDLTISVAESNGYVELQVRDTGPGISEDKLAKVFDPLFSTKAKGIGMGLPIVGEVVHKHNGTIDVTSNPGEGTTFTIKLPLDNGLTGNGSATNGSASNGLSHNGSASNGLAGDGSMPPTRTSTANDLGER